MSSYSYLNHVESEFLESEEEYGDEADRILGKFFQGRSGLQSRAFLEEDLRYIVIANGDSIEILEEEGNWDSNVLEPKDENKYELIYEEKGNIITEEVEAEKVESHLR